MYFRNGIIWVSLKENGKWVRRSTGLEDTKENRRIVAAYNTDEAPRYLFPPFSILAEKFMETKKYKADGTINDYQRTIDYFVDSVTDMQPRLIEAKHIDIFKDYLISRGLSHNTVSSHIRNLRIVFNYFKEMGFIEKNLVAKIDPEEKPIAIIPDAKMDKFLALLKKRNIGHYRFIKFLTLTGFRTGEAIALKWDDIQFDNNRIVFENFKGRRYDQFPIREPLRSFLMSFKGSGSVFGYKSTDSLKWLKKVFVKELPGYTFHDIRRTFCTTLLKNNVNAYKVRSLMRHKDFQTTIKHYAFIDSQETGDELERVFNVTDVTSRTPSNTAVNKSKNKAIKRRNKSTE